MSGHTDRRADLAPGALRQLLRWRMALGRYSEGRLGSSGLLGEDLRRDQLLERIYAERARQRGLRIGKGRPGRGGSLDPSQITIPDWLADTRRLFPKSVFETIQGHALNDLGLAGLFADPASLKKLEPNLDLMKVLLAFKGRADRALAEAIRDIVRQVVEDLKRKLRAELERALSGRRDRFRRGQLRSAANLDLKRTIRENLRHWSPAHKAIIAERLHFNARQKRRLPWTIILCVDQSGSMLNSLIHATVMASILAGLPSVEIRFVAFDTAIVDLSDKVADPVDLLLAVQLGGGTDIARAMAYCETLVKNPGRTVLVLISDFEEGGSRAELLRTVKRLAEARVRLIGLAALAPGGEAVFDRAMAERLAALGMHIAAMTPDRFAEWLAGVMN
ncbi:MAG TPA: VWA domain-containing protein [Xanthobacteraceae bacterium]|nr:VWA domain-containing protein [Xanthobacteraceae bacterium]